MRALMIPVLLVMLTGCTSTYTHQQKLLGVTGDYVFPEGGRNAGQTLSIVEEASSLFMISDDKKVAITQDAADYRFKTGVMVYNRETGKKEPEWFVLKFDPNLQQYYIIPEYAMQQRDYIERQ